MTSVTRKHDIAKSDPGRLEIALRCLWICVQITSSYLLAEQVSPFFYQQF